MGGYTSQSQAYQVGRESVSRLRSIVEAGRFRKFAEVNPNTGNVLDGEARALFAGLPVITPGSSVDTLMELGLLNRLPAGLDEVHRMPRYTKDRAVFVKTTVDHQYSTATKAAGRFRKDGEHTFTHQAVLKAEKDELFEVEVAGASEPLLFAKRDIFAWNEARGSGRGGGCLSGVRIDYAAPRMRAFVCAGYLSIASKLAEIDFGEPTRVTVQKQSGLIYRLASMVDMHYLGRDSGYSGDKASSLIGGGSGVCFAQRAVAAAFLQAFDRILAFQVQAAVGRTLSLDVPHGFVVITLLPSLQRFVCDPAWREPLTALDIAFFGPGWGHDRRLDGFEGEQFLEVSSESIDLPQHAPNNGTEGER